MAKKVKVMESCVLTTDDKGQRTLVGKAKEALTTMSKNGIDVTIFLEKTVKDDAEKFLKEQNVPYKELINGEDMKEGEKRDFDLCIYSDDKVVLLRSDWQWALDSVAEKLYGVKKQEKQPTEQEKMDKAWKDYKKWATENAKSHPIG